MPKLITFDATYLRKVAPPAILRFYHDCQFESGPTAAQIKFRGIYILDGHTLHLVFSDDTRAVGLFTKQFKTLTLHGQTYSLLGEEQVRFHTFNLPDEIFKTTAEVSNES
jgi:hypothetical protein